MTEAKEKTRYRKNQATRARTTRHPGVTRQMQENSTNAPCAEIICRSPNLYLPVDIIWAIDSSGSMRQEIDLIQERMNGFASFY